MNNTTRLPLWKSCLEVMGEEGVEYGKVYPAEFFERHLKVPRNSMKFSLRVSRIRRRLEENGFYLSGHGQKGNQYVILPPESNAAVLRNYESSSRDALRRAVTLGSTTNLESLNAAQQKRHERCLERVSIRLALMQRARKIYGHVKETAPKLLAPRNGSG